MKTAIQELKDWANQYKGQMISADQVVLQAHNLLKKEKEQMINFHAWMRMNDSSEAYFHYSDEDMLNEYLNQNK
jgi:hypothetical protein